VPFWFCALLSFSFRGILFSSRRDNSPLAGGRAQRTPPENGTTNTTDPDGVAALAVAPRCDPFEVDPARELDSGGAPAATSG